MKKTILRCGAIFVVLTLVSAFFLTGCSPKAESIDEAAKRLNTYTIEGAYSDKSRTLTAIERVSFVNRTGQNLQELWFNLYPNAYREDALYKAVAVADRAKAYPSGASWGRIDINYVKLESGTATFSVGGEDSNILSVSLPAGLPPNGSVEVEISFTVHLAHVYDRLGWNDKTVHLTNFYPVLCVFEGGAFVAERYMSYGDPFYAEAANFHVSLTYPTRFNAAHTGDRVDTVESGGSTTIVVEAKAVRDFAVALNASKQMVSLTSGGLTINYHFVGDTQPEQSLEIAKKAMEEFSDMFGGYPYNKVEIFEAPFARGGMEYAGLVIVAAGLKPIERNEVIVHELCHQWWYGLVGNNQHSTAWLDEGLADFGTLLFFQRHPDYEIEKQSRVKQAEMNYALFVDVLKGLTEADDTTMTRKLSEYGGEREYVFMTYVKGMLMFEAVYKTIGEKAFLKCLQRLFADKIFSVATESDVIAVFEKTSRKKLSGLFRSWLDGKVVIARLAS